MLPLAQADKQTARTVVACVDLCIPVNDVNLVQSLLQAIVNIDGEALVMHAGDKPYVVSPTGQVELASRGLTLEAVNGIVAQLLPVEYQHALDEFGAVQCALSPQEQFPHEQFTVVVARGGDDVWAEIRRHRVPDDDLVPADLFGAPALSSDHSSRSMPAAMPMPDADIVEIPPATVAAPAAAIAAQADSDDHDLGEFGGPVPEMTIAPPVEDRATPMPAVAETDVVAPQAPTIEHRVAPMAPIVPERTMAPPPPVSQVTVIPIVQVAEAPPIASVTPVAEPPPASFETPPEHATASLSEMAAPNDRATAPPRIATPAPVPPPAPPSVEQTVPPSPTRHVPPPGVLLPMSRSPIRMEAPPAPSGDTLSGLERLLRTAAARGASTLYLSSDARPSVRVDGELQNLDSEPVHTSSDVISLLLSLMPDRSHEALRTGATTEWICDIEDIGRVRCMSFSDHRGPGGVFRLMPVRTVSVDQLGLSAEIQALAVEPEGLVLIAGSRSSGKRTLISSMVDLINRTRRDHVITIEREVNIVHDRGSSFISQREVRGTDDDVLAAARAALREDPDVLVLEQIRTGLLMNVALEAAASGHLVIAGFSAHNATESIDRILSLYAPEYARQVQLALADNLRGVIAQVLLPRVGGGRVAAREVLLNTPAVAGVIAEGKTSQLPMAIEAGRRVGMMPLNDALVSCVQSGAVDLREAHRHVTDRPAFLASLKRQGVDTSAFERLA
jgi:twitching motility protein PilT